MPTPRKNETREQMNEWLRAKVAPVVVSFDRGRWTPKTRSAYELAWRHFSARCKREGVAAIPAAAEDIAAFLTEHAETHSASTVSQSLAGIKAAHEMHGFDVRVKGTVIADAWSDIRRRKGTRKQPKQALEAPELRTIITKMPDSLRGTRDKAVLLFGLMSAMRRSELASLDIADLTFSPKGVLVLLRHSKTDKASKGQTIDVPRMGTVTCPVAALERWIAVAGIEDGAVFRNLPVNDSRIDGREVANVVKKAVALIGKDPRIFGGHSLRRGFITSAFKGGAKLEDIMKRSRHSTYDIARGYIEELDVFKNPADAAVGL